MATRKQIALPRRRLANSLPGELKAIAAAAFETSYFASGANKEGLRFVSSGCVLNDCALGGGYVLGRIANIVGDKSSGKTLKAMEVCANFALQYPDGWIRYAESEAAFDQPYAAALGVPIDRIDFNPKGEPMRTVEELYEDLIFYLDKYPKRPGLYIVDSLDALSDDAEQDRGFDEGSYGGTKPKQIGKLFRMLVARLEEQGVLFIVISQLRDKLNVTFGETKTRSGGRALDFYATHIEWLAETAKLRRTIAGVERVTGITVETYIKKNKIGPAFRKAKYPVLFGYGIDDMTSSAEWLLEIGRERILNELGMRKGSSSRAKTKAEAKERKPEDEAKTAHLVLYKDFIERVRDQGGVEAQALREVLAKRVLEEWARIELTFLPRARKY